MNENFAILKSDDRYEVSFKYQDKIFKSELSVLTGFSHESIDEAYKQLISLQTFPLKLDLLEQNPFAVLGDLELYPSVRFCVESLLLQTLKPKTFKKKYRVNDLIFLNFSNDAQNTFSETVKIKIGREDAKIEIEKIVELLSSHPEILKVRLDANQNLTLKDLDFYQIPQLEYFESPLRNFSDYQHCSHPIALDEDIELLHTHPKPQCVKALVYKPKVRLGISGMIKMIDKFPQMDHILTHSYEGILGKMVLEKLPLYIPELNQGWQGLNFKYLDQY